VRIDQPKAWLRHTPLARARAVPGYVRWRPSPGQR
jgi:hypothetical protein